MAMVRVTLVLALLGGLLVTGPAPALAQAPIKIGVVQGLTGPFEVYAKQMVNGFKLGLEYATGGKVEIGGRKVELLIEDDQLKPDVAKRLVTKPYADDKADTVGAMGPPGWATAGALAMGSWPGLRPGRKTYRFQCSPVMLSATAGSTTRSFLNSCATGRMARAAALDVVPTRRSTLSSA